MFRKILLAVVVGTGLFGGANLAQAGDKNALGAVRLPRATKYLGGAERGLIAFLETLSETTEAKAKAAKGKCSRFAIGVASVPTIRQAMSAPSGALAPHSSATHREA